MSRIMSKYFIVNDIDRPYARLVAKMKDDGRIYYMDPTLAKAREYEQGFNVSQATAMEAFGFEITENKDSVRFVKTRSSIAVYKDGRVRHWQGAEDFTIPHGKEC